MPVRRASFACHAGRQHPDNPDLCLLQKYRDDRAAAAGPCKSNGSCQNRRPPHPLVLPLPACLQKYRDAAMIELEALNTLAANDPGREKHCVQLLEWFNYRQAWAPDAASTNSLID